MLTSVVTLLTNNRKKKIVIHNFLYNKMYMQSDNFINIHLFNNIKQ